MFWFSFKFSDYGAAIVPKLHKPVVYLNPRKVHLEGYITYSFLFSIDTGTNLQYGASEKPQYVRLLLFGPACTAASTQVRS